MDEKLIAGLRIAQARAQAMRSSGSHDDAYIVDSVMSIPTMPQQVKDILKQAKVQGVASKAIDDILQLPVASKPDVSPVTSEDTRNTLKRSLGDTVGGSIANVSEFLGIDKIGRAIGSTLGGGKVRELAAEGKITPEESKNFQQAGSTKLELLGSAAQTLGSVVAPGLTKAAAGAMGLVKGSAAVGAGFGAAGGLQAGHRDLGSLAGDAALGAGIGAAVPIAGKLLQYAAGRLGSKALSIATGEGTDVIESALKNPRAADAAISNGDDALRTVVQKGAAETVQLRDAFNKAYRTGIEQIGELAEKQTGSAVITDRTKVKDAFIKALESAKITVGKGGKLNFTQSQAQANPGEVAKIQQAYDALKTWKDFSFAGADDFKHLIGKLTRFADDAGVPSKSPTLGRAYNSINNLIKASLPEDLGAQYTAANSKYSKTIDVYDEMVDAFNKGDPFSRLANLFSKNKDSLRQVVDFYDNKTGEGVAATVAGRELAAEKTAAFGILNPRSWLDFFISPQIQAKGITAVGKGQEFVRNSPTARTLGNVRASVGPRFLTGIEAGTSSGNIEL